MSTSSGLLLRQLCVNTVPQLNRPLFTAADIFRSSTANRTVTMTTFEDILEEAGKFGRCQMRIVSIFCLVSIPFSFVYVGIVFQGFTPEHWCRDPGVSEIRERCGWSLQEARRATVPLMNSSTGVTYSQCQKLDMDWNATGLICDNPESELTLARLSTLPMTGCADGWEYDYEGRQSFVTEVSGGITKQALSFGNNCVKCNERTKCLTWDLCFAVWSSVRRRLVCWHVPGHAQCWFLSGQHCNWIHGRQV